MSATSPLSASPTRGPMVPRRYRIAEVRRELPDTVTLGLEPVDHEPRPCAPGQFNMLWSFGAHEVAISVSGLPGDSSPLHHTVRAVGVGSAALCAQREGDVIGVRGPFGTPWDLQGALDTDVVVMAGGLGLAPLRPAIHELLRHRDAYRSVSVLVGARSPEALVYEAEIRRWRDDPRITVEVTADSAGPGWWGDVGVVTSLLDRLALDAANTAALVCGPELMMRYSATALTDRGVRRDAIQVSLERNMVCAIGHCGHCQLGPVLVCQDGAVFSYDRAAPLLAVRGR